MKRICTVLTSSNAETPSPIRCSFCGRKARVVDDGDGVFLRLECQVCDDPLPITIPPRIPPLPILLALRRFNRFAA